MEINRNNYEAYLLDLLEGSLTAEELQAVHDFLLLNPDCAEGIKELNVWSLEKSSIVFPGKEQLKKEIPDASFMLTESNFDLFSIARLEGDLTNEQEKDHASMVAKNRDKRKEWAEWQQTKMNVDPIIYTHKKQLKHRKKISGRVIWISAVSSAAVIALLFTLLRIDPAAPGSELAVETEASQTATKEETRLQTSDESISSDGKPVLFSIRKNPEREEESLMNEKSKDAGIESDTINQVRKGEIHPKPLKIARHGSNITDLVMEGTYDHIKHLEIPPASIHMGSLSISQLSELDLQEVFDDYTRENEVSLWSIANAGIRGINRITGADMSLLASRDDEGDVSGFRFKSKRFSITTPLDQSK